LYDQPGDLLAEYSTAGVDLVRVNGSASSGSFSFDKKEAFKSGLAFTRFIRRGIEVKPDVVYINQPYDALFGGLLARVLGCELVCHLRLPPGDFCKQWKVGLRRVSRFIAISEQTRREYVAAGFPEQQISLVYNAVDPDLYRRVATHKFRSAAGISPAAFVVGYAGRIDREKGLETLLSGFAKSLGSEGAKLLIAGQPVCPRDADEPLSEYLDELKAYARSLGIAEHVHWVGHISDLPEFYSSCDVTVLPTSKFSEPFGRVLIESMLCETPVIGSRIGGIPEVLSGDFSKFLFEPENDGELARLLMSVKTLRIDDRELGTKSRRYVMAKFPLEGMLDGIESILTGKVGLAASSS
jgi:glycosyltransferase involved in cell wall biosynthesis